MFNNRKDGFMRPLLGRFKHLLRTIHVTYLVYEYFIESTRTLLFWTTAKHRNLSVFLFPVGMGFIIRWQIISFAWLSYSYMYVECACDRGIDRTGEVSTRYANWQWQLKSSVLCLTLERVMNGWPVENWNPKTGQLLKLRWSNAFRTGNERCYMF